MVTSGPAAGLPGRTQRTSGHVLGDSAGRQNEMGEHPERDQHGVTAPRAGARVRARTRCRDRGRTLLRV